MTNKTLIIGEKTFKSRLFVGTGKFPSTQSMRDSVVASGSEMVTVALRRVDNSGNAEGIVDALMELGVLILPNTSGAIDAAEAVRMAKLADAMGLPKYIKVEVTPDPRNLLPDGEETLKACQELVDLGFTVLPYINADPILARKLEAIGCATVMPLAAPIGTNKGLKTIDQIKIIIENASIPVVVDAGLGAPSHAAEAMEAGADAVLVNTAIATADNPVLMAEAFKQAVIAGQMGFEAGQAQERSAASASSPLDGVLEKLI